MNSVGTPADQVFIVGMNGSGTTMLLDHLSSHPRIFGFPGETKVLPFFLNRESSYGDLSVDENYRKLWRDMSTAIVGRSFEDAPEAMQSADCDRAPRSAALVFDRLMRWSAGRNGKRIWCEKSPMHVLHLRLLGKAFPDAKFIHVIRDGRDCAASFHRRWRFNPRRMIARWKAAVRQGQDQGASLGARYLEIRYEELTRDPERAFRAICSFVGIEFDNAVLAVGRSRHDIASAKSTSVVQNMRSAETYFDRSTLVELEKIAGRCLAQLGYPVSDRVGDLDPPAIRLRWWELTDEARRLTVVLFRGGRLLKPRSWGYLMRRIGGALKQKSALSNAQYGRSHGGRAGEPVSDSSQDRSGA